MLAAGTAALSAGASFDEATGTVGEVARALVEENEEDEEDEGEPLPSTLKKLISRSDSHPPVVEKVQSLTSPSPSRSPRRKLPRR